MSNIRHNPKRDANETRIVRELEQLGFKVIRINQANIPDLLVMHPRGGMVLVEVKTKRGRLSPGQEAEIADILDHGGEAFTARCTSDVLRAFGMIEEANGG